MNAHPHNLKRLWLSSVLCCLAMAGHAETIEGTLIAGQPSYYRDGTVVLSAANTTRLQLSNVLLAILNTTRTQVTPVAPGTADITRNSRNRYTSVALDAPVAALTAEFNGNFDELKAKNFISRGGLLLVTESDELTTTGGSLSITNLRVDFDTKEIRADIDGANGVGQMEQVSMWNFGKLTPLGQIAHTVCSRELIGCRTTVSIATTVSGLSFTPHGFDVFHNSLGLTEDGISSLSHVTDFGTITASVPEPSTIAQMGLGLAALTFLAKRRRRTTH